MKNELSILLPTYQCLCGDLVKELHRQCEQCGISFEIIVADDGSKDRSFVERNREIEKLQHVTYMKEEQNRGRAAIRNLLAQEAQYEWLVFCDGDMSLENPLFIRNYCETDGSVIYGGYTVGNSKDRPRNNLRYEYEKDFEDNHIAEKRRQHPYHDFHTSNFLVKRSIMLEHPFDERFLHYGFEDVFWGKILRQNGIFIAHINNPLCFADFEDNPTFVEKTEESLRTLNDFQDELAEYSGVLRLTEKLEKFHLLPMVKFSYKTIGQNIRNNLTGNNPMLFLFYIYKLMYFVHVRDLTPKNE